MSQVGAGATPAPGVSGPEPAGASRQLRVWRAVAAAVLVAGLVGSVFAAIKVADNEATQSRRALRTSAQQVASTLQLAIQREEDLVVSLSGFITDTPDASNSHFLQWARSVRALDRYPELDGLGQVVVVPAAGLTAYAARVVADPLGTLPPGGTFKITPAGARPYYCLAPIGLGRTPQVVTPGGIDYCASALGPVMLSARDSGESAYLPYLFERSHLLSVFIPTYRGLPATVTARRAAFVGWEGMTLHPQVLLDRALTGHPGLAVTMRYDAGASDVAFQEGSAAGGARTESIDLRNGWTVRTSGVVAGGGVFASGTALGLLLAGTGLSVLLAALLLVLATGRGRALALVGLRTEELRHQALHDALTGLPNRALITDRTEQLLARTRRHGTVAAALFVDLDEFKNVNDTLGHESGDQLLQAVAARLRTSLRDADTFGRMGGDEFVVLIDGGTLNVAPDLVAERMLEVMRQPFQLAAAANPMIVTTSIGIAIGDRESSGILLRDADVALYQAKAAGKNCYAVFHEDMEADVRQRFELEFDLRSALAGDQFRLVYQPIYSLDDLTLVGVEALIRWEHPTLGQVQPDDFIPLLEASGQIIEVGEWVLREACGQMASWRARGSDLIISVNVSARQLDRDSIVDHVRAALADSGLDPAALTVEITESTLMRNIDTTAHRLQQLKALGIQIAIDDFGTGYSSLAYLQRFPVDSLKIDRTFINAITHAPESKALIHTLVQLGRHLGLKTLAEGVENTRQLDHLRKEGVNEVQGFLLAKPLDPETLETRLLSPARHTEATPSTPQPPA